MTSSELVSRILAFALHCGEASEDGRDTAIRNGWIDEAGIPTQEGRALIDALDAQRATRSVYRTVL